MIRIEQFFNQLSLIWTTINSKLQKDSYNNFFQDLLILLDLKMSKQLEVCQQNFKIIDGEFHFDEPSNQFSERYLQKKVNLSTSYATLTSNGEQIENSNEQIPSNNNDEKFQQEAQKTDIFDLQVIDDQSPDQPFNGAPQQTTVTFNQIERNDSKNVPKGLIKAFAHMVLDKNPNTVRTLKEYFKSSGESYEEFKNQMKKIRKSSKISISEIRQLLMKLKFGETMRKLGCYFLRKRFINHIFNSKMEKRHIHMKYIPKWMDVFKNPSEFTSLK